jgi:7-carboxy-7-deazaguanine synthase
MLTVSEIFASIQGETSYSGYPFSLEEVVSRVEAFGLARACVTGGEPLLQAEAFALVTALLNRGHEVLVETNGTVPLAALDPRAVKIMDVKCPGSGEHGKTAWENFRCLTDRDEVKFVISSEEDYRYAREIAGRYRVETRWGALFSPAYGSLAPETLAGWMVGDRLDARFQLQLHKILWGPDRRGV